MVVALEVSDETPSRALVVSGWSSFRGQDLGRCPRTARAARPEAGHSEPVRRQPDRTALIKNRSQRR